MNHCAVVKSDSVNVSINLNTNEIFLFQIYFYLVSDVRNYSVKF